MKPFMLKNFACNEDVLSILSNTDLDKHVRAALAVFLAGGSIKPLLAVPGHTRVLEVWANTFNEVAEDRGYDSKEWHSAASQISLMIAYTLALENAKFFLSVDERAKLGIAALISKQSFSKGHFGKGYAASLGSLNSLCIDVHTKWGIDLLTPRAQFTPAECQNLPLEYVHSVLQSSQAKKSLLDLDFDVIREIIEDVDDEENDYSIEVERMSYFDKSRHAAFDANDEKVPTLLCEDTYFDLDFDPDSEEEPARKTVTSRRAAPVPVEIDPLDDDEFEGDDTDAVVEEPARKKRPGKPPRKVAGKPPRKEAVPKKVAQRHVDAGESLPVTVAQMQQEKGGDFDTTQANDWAFTPMMEIRDIAMYDVSAQLDDVTRFDDIVYADGKGNWWADAAPTLRTSKIFEILSAYWNLRVDVETAEQPSMGLAILGLEISINEFGWQAKFAAPLVEHSVIIGSSNRGRTLREVLENLTNVFDCLRQDELKRIIIELGFYNDDDDAIFAGKLQTDFEFGGDTMIGTVLYGENEPDEINTIADLLVGDFLWKYCDEIRGSEVLHFNSDSIELRYQGTVFSAFRTATVSIDDRKMPLYTLNHETVGGVLHLVGIYREDRMRFMQKTGIVIHSFNGNEVMLIMQVDNKPICIYGKDLYEL